MCIPSIQDLNISKARKCFDHDDKDKHLSMVFEVIGVVNPDAKWVGKV